MSCELLKRGKHFFYLMCNHTVFEFLLLFIWQKISLKLIYVWFISKVHVAIDIVDEMSKAGLTSSTDALNSILIACEENYEFNLVCRFDSDHFLVCIFGWLL